jgi:hypothetical protein
MKYLVRWEIDSDAATPLEAAREARAAQLRPDTTATVFDVYEPDAPFTEEDNQFRRGLHGPKATRIDLQEHEEEIFTCRGCGREESVCSADPCPGVIADREGRN